MKIYIRDMVYWMFCLFLVFILGCQKQNIEEKQEPVMTVTTIVPKLESIPLIVNANGIIKPWQEAIISAEVGGLDLVEVNVNIGDKVHKGQVLARLNTAQIDTDVMNQLANVAEAKANLEQARTNSLQANELQKYGAISNQDLLDYTTKSKTAKAKLEAARAILKMNYLKIAYAVIKAPDNGIISSRTATVGNVIANGSELFRLIRDNRIEWQAQINQKDADKIRTGQLAQVINHSGVMYSGLVRKLSPALNDSTKNAIVYVDLPSGTDLKLDMYLSGTIIVGSRQALLIPAKSIINDDGFTYVFRLKPDYRVEKIKIVIGEYYKDMVPVVSGLSPKDTIVAAGSGFLNDGDLVAVNNQRVPK